MGIPASLPLMIWSWREFYKHRVDHAVLSADSATVEKTPNAMSSVSHLLFALYFYAFILF